MEEIEREREGGKGDRNAHRCISHEINYFWHFSLSKHFRRRCFWLVFLFGGFSFYFIFFFLFFFFVLLLFHSASRNEKLLQKLITRQTQQTAPQAKGGDSGETKGRQRGDREETVRRQKGDREETVRRQKGDSKSSRQRQQLWQLRQREAGRQGVGRESSSLAHFKHPPNKPIHSALLTHSLTH